MFLTPEEVADLTGYVRYADQRRWLDNIGWKYEKNAAGRPIVLRAFVEKQLGITKNENDPDFSIFDKAA